MRITLPFPPSVNGLANSALTNPVGFSEYASALMKRCRKNKPDVPKIYRFMSNIKVAHNECWEWQRRLSFGYGTYSYDGENRAHRSSYLMFVGDFDRKLYICHHCDNRKCVNPAHLFVGTAKENTWDGIRKGRIDPMMGTPKPGLHPNRKLEVADVCIIKERIAKGDRPTHIARDYGVGQPCIDKIKRGKSWGYV